MSMLSQRRRYDRHQGVGRAHSQSFRELLNPIREFPKIRGTYFGVLIRRILLFRQ